MYPASNGIYVSDAPIENSLKCRETARFSIPRTNEVRVSFLS
jgi:hypothetical protein